MIVFKNNAGFTLIEAVLSITLIAIIMTPLMITQGSIVQTVSNVSLRLQRIFFAENFLIDAQEKAQEQSKFFIENKIDTPISQFSFDRKPVDEKSPFAKIKHLVLDQVTVTWQEDNKKQKEVLVAVQYIKA